ncbi:LCP family protein [Frigoribacterium sp. ACAM 257]|uniref:LCP family protein n=1 Tax=Frigoribacterium sp. ACAM 257 TaxID=2508998 RepID=UPI00174E50E5|nr:LCP family protein [Frigoribacterium sp. ACAM 257]
MTDIFTRTTDDGDGQSSAEGPRKGRRLSRGTKVLIVLASIVVGILLVAIVGVGVWASRLAATFDDNATTIEQAFPDESTRPVADETGAMNILLMGSDSRADPTTVDDSAASDQRTDSMMLVHVDADRKAVWVMSIMRDLYVPIPGHGEAKINAAFAYGGSALTVQTVEQLLGVRIDHVAIIDFEGFKGMTTALGGVDVSSPQAFTARGHSYVEGVNRLEGDAALAFVRERYAFPDGDFTRVENQQAFVKGLANTVLGRSTLTDPGKVSDFVTAMSPYLSVDAGFDVGTIGSLAFSLRNLDSSTMHFFTIPTAGTGMVGDQSVVNVDQAGLETVKAALADDGLAAVVAAD